MRALIVTSTFPLCDGDTRPAFVFNFAKTLVRQGLEVHVVTPWGQVEGESLPPMEWRFDEVIVYSV